MGDNQKMNYVEFAKTWFLENQVPIPKTVKEWSKASVRRKEIPPGMSYQKLQKEKYSLAALLKEIDPDTQTRLVNYDPITPENIDSLLGLSWVASEITKSKHRVVTISCNSCKREENLDYGTLQRMRVRKDFYCRYCRGAGGKEKDIAIYDIFECFTAKCHDGNKNIIYKCETCEKEIKRTQAHVSAAEYIVCEICHPGIAKTNIENQYGKFDSVMELKSYQILLRYFQPSEIIRQASYHELFNTDTKHSLDFYIPKIDLKLEVTTLHNKFAPRKYQETKEWKQSFGVIFAYTLKEVEDIVRSYMKV